MNFVSAFQKGKEGMNLGLPMGIPPLTRDTLGTQKEHIYSIAAPPKVGKTTLIDFIFLLAIYMLSPNANVEWIYYSFEISRIKKEFKFAAFFMFRDFGIQFFEHEGKQYPISADYLMGKLLDDNNKPIVVHTEHEEQLRIIYRTRIIPLFGEYNIRGERIRKGKIDFIEHRENPTGIRNYILTYARTNGKFIMEKYTIIDKNGDKENKERIIGYQPNDENKMLIVITDHVRKLIRERNFSMKENIDKFAEYQVELRNICKFIFVNVIHTNRNIFDIERIKYAGEYFYPSSEDVKDTGNLSEDSNVLFTMFNPNDDKYGIKKHFGLEVVDKNDKLVHPNYRSLHIVEARDFEAPLHYQLNMFGNINWFNPIKK